MSTVWNRARANNGCGLDDALFERCVTCADPIGDPANPFDFDAVPPEGNDWHLVCWIEDNEGRPAVLWRRLKAPHEIVP
jgi:hypothetical protein